MARKRRVIRQRKPTCFVCFAEFDDVTRLRDHVIESHEEGRDYVICPLCNYPVRDIPSHAKAKHPGRKMPAVKNLRAQIWRKVPKTKKTDKRQRPSRFHNGFFLSEKNQRHLQYRSGWERKAYTILEDANDVIRFSPEHCIIPYSFMGQQHRYIPDILIEFRDGERWLIEIKPKSQIDWKRNRAKWRAAEAFCRARRWHFAVWTDAELKTISKRQKIDGGIRIRSNDLISWDYGDL